MTRCEVFKIPMSSPSDISELKKLVDCGNIDARDIVAIIAKTEGNGCVNDFSRGYATNSFQEFLSCELGMSKDSVARRVAFVMSGGTEGVLSPHANIFVNKHKKDGGSFIRHPTVTEKRLTIGVSHTRDFLPEEIGRMPMVIEVCRVVKQIMDDIGLCSPKDVHFVQSKCPLLTSERISEAKARNCTVSTTNTYKSMGYSRGATALGIAIALGEVPAESVSDETVCSDWTLFSNVASTSAGVELMNCEIVVMGNSEASQSDLVIGHSVMKDAIDIGAVIQALRSVAIDVEDCQVPDDKRIVNVFAKAEPDPSGVIRGKRHTMLNDSDINETRHSRAAVGAVIASVVGDPQVYVSGGAEHQGPPGGGPVAVIARVLEMDGDNVTKAKL